MTPTVVLCMAGLYRRFRDAGYTTPKFLLPAGERTILGWIAAELGAERVLMVANERDRTHADAIVAAVREAGAAPELVFTGDTAGQAATAAIGARAVLATGDAPIVFHNVDTVLFGRDLARIGAALARADGFIDTFPHTSAAYSYVAVGDPEADGLSPITEMAEKVVISAHATTGLYGFRSASEYLRWCGETTGRSKGEFYVSDVYRQMLAQGCTLLADTRGTGQRTLVLGTPAEYEAWRDR